MPEHQTAAETLARHIARMGEPLGRLYHHLWQQVVWLNVKWNEHLELFGTKPSRIVLLNNAAPRFFRIIQDLLFEETLLHIARLTDQPASGLGKDKKRNLTIRALPPLVDDPVRSALVELVKISVEKSAFARDWRNRHIAHLDLDLALNDGTTPLSDVTRGQINEAIESLGKVLNAIDAHYYDAETMFGFKNPIGGAISLLYVLDDGLRTAADRDNRIRSGDFQREDMEARDL